MQENATFINCGILDSVMKEIQNKLKKLKDSLFEESLPHIFTDWQIKIIKKRLNNLPLNNTEKSEFSRNIKKKIVAIQALRDLAFILY